MVDRKGIKEENVIEPCTWNVYPSNSRGNTPELNRTSRRGKGRTQRHKLLLNGKQEFPKESANEKDMHVSGMMVLATGKDKRPDPALHLQASTAASLGMRATIVVTRTMSKETMGLLVISLGLFRSFLNGQKHSWRPSLKNLPENVSDLFQTLWQWLVAFLMLMEMRWTNFIFIPFLSSNSYLI